MSPSLIIVLLIPPVALFVRYGSRLGRRSLVLCVGVLGFGLAAALTALLGTPLPRVHDEFSYLLAGDTFANGRLTNPTPPAWPCFETFHELVRPSFMSKYPPGQGLFLALGYKIAGIPIVGVWISMMAFGAALCWCLLGFVEPGWAATLAALYTVHVGTAEYLGAPGYWAHSYWGGAVAATGGALVLGAAKRLCQKVRSVDAVWLVLGLATLANSRPFEGLFMALPLLWVVGKSVARSESRSARLRTCLPAAALLTFVAIVMAYSNYRVTGHALRMPYMEHDAQYASSPPIVFMSSGYPTYHNAEMASFYAVDRRLWLEHRTWAGFSEMTVDKARIAFDFYVGPLWACVLLALPFALRERWARIALASVGSTLFAYGMLNFMQAHYLAPAAAPFAVVLAVSMRAWAARFGPTLVVAISTLAVVANGLVPLTQAFLRKENVNEFPFDRARVGAELLAKEGHHLVLVNYGREHSPHLEWIYNRAELSTARIVWVRDGNLALVREIVAAFPYRTLWQLNPDNGKGLTPYRLPPAP